MFAYSSGYVRSNFTNGSPLLPFSPWLSASAGVSSADFANLTAVLDAVPAISWITLDVANGYSEVWCLEAKIFFRITLLLTVLDTTRVDSFSVTRFVVHERPFPATRL